MRESPAAIPVLLVRAAHPRQAVTTAAGLAAAAVLVGRPGREAALVAATVLVGQAVLGWDDDVADRRRDAAHDRDGKPVAAGRLEPGTVWFAMACAVLLLVPLAASSGRAAAVAYLLSVVVGVVGNRLLQGSRWSFVPWAAAFALYPAFVLYGGWAGAGRGDPPSILVTVLAAALGVGVHVLHALPGLVADRADGSRSLPLLIALRTGAPRLLALTGGYLLVVVLALVATGQTVGLTG